MIAFFSDDVKLPFWGMVPDKTAERIAERALNISE
jgi:hypothetical protein